MFSFGKENVNEGGNGVAIFNNGVAGRVETVSVAVTKKGVDYVDENGKNNPDYKVVYTDAAGNSTSEGFYYLNEKTHNAQYGTFEKAVEKQWNKFATIVTVSGGDPAVNADSPVAMLDQMALKVRDIVVDKKYNVLTNYGTKSNPKRFLQIRSWAPFIELATVSAEDTKLKLGSLDQEERIEAPQGGSAAPTMSGWV